MILKITKLVRNSRVDVRLGTLRHRTCAARVHGSDRPPTTLRMWVTAAFQAMAGALDGKTAYAKTKAFYRSSGFEWTRALS